MATAGGGGARSVGTWLFSVDRWAESFVGFAWAQNGRQEHVEWESLPLSSIWAPILGTAVYTGAIFLMQRAMRDRKPFTRDNSVFFNYALFVHNAVLCLASCAMCAGLVAALVDFVGLHGWWHVYCDPEWRLPSHPLSVWLYAFYVSKYYELLDTLFVLLKKRPLRFVQFWHHTTVLWLFWSYNKARMLNHWVLALLNTFVHVFVYGYFAANTVGVAVPWKNSITLLQITQFAVDILYSLPFAPVKVMGGTPGDWAPFLIGQFIGLTFLYLFAQIYFENRGKLRKAKRE